MIDGKETNKNMGRMGGMVASCGMVSTNVAIRLQASSSPKLAAAMSSVQKSWRNLIGGSVFRHLRISKNGGLCDLAILKAV